MVGVLAKASILPRRVEAALRPKDGAMGVGFVWRLHGIDRAIVFQWQAARDA